MHEQFFDSSHIDNQNKKKHNTKFSPNIQTSRNMIIGYSRNNKFLIISNKSIVCISKTFNKIKEDNDNRTKI